MKKIIILFLFFTALTVYAKNIYPADPNAYLQPMSFFDKMTKWKKDRRARKNPSPKKMPVTYEEWNIDAQNIPLDKRDNPKITPEANKKLTRVLNRACYFVKYNNPPGGREINLSEIKKYSNVNSEGVINENFDKIAYTSHFYYPESNQITSKLQVFPLDTSKNRMERVKKANILKAPKENILSSGMNEIKKDLFSSLTILDWSKDSDFLIVKEKIGSLNSGIFRTNLYKVDLDEDCNTLQYKKIDLETPIKRYWAQNKIKINFYRWDTYPLGFSKENEDEIIVLAWAWSKKNKKYFLGTWKVSLINDDIELISSENLPKDIAIHGITVRCELP